MYKDREVRLQYHRLYNEKHRDHLKQLHKEYYARLSEDEKAERNARSRTFYALHKDKILAKRRLKKQSQTKEQVKENRLYHKAYSHNWAKQNRDKRLASLHKRRALKRNNGIGIVDYEDICVRDDNRCQICGRRVTKATRSFDHIIPISLNGSHTQSNIQLTHLTCNVKRGAGRSPAQTRMLP